MRRIHKGGPTRHTRHTRHIYMARPYGTCIARNATSAMQRATQHARPPHPAAARLRRRPGIAHRVRYLHAFCKYDVVCMIFASIVSFVRCGARCVTRRGPMQQSAARPAARRRADAPARDTRRHTIHCPRKTHQSTMLQDIHSQGHSQRQRYSCVENSSPPLPPLSLSTAQSTCGRSGLR